MSFSFSRFAWSLVFLVMNWWNPAYSVITLSSFSSSSSSTTTSTSAYASAVEEVLENDYLVEQILTYVSARSLPRLRRVSKKWNRIITSHEFGIIHTRRVRHPKATSLLMHHVDLNHRHWILLPLGTDQNQNHPPAIKTVNFDYLDDHPGAETTVINSCNGLSLCYVRSLHLSYHAFFVTNITTKKFIKLPPSDLMMKRCADIKLALAFDPATAPHFKVLLCVSRIAIEDGYEMEIYSSKTHQWRRWYGSFINSWYTMNVFERGVVWNGAIHWLCPKGDSFYFSINDESMRVLQLPPLKWGSLKANCARLMGQSGGYLHLVDVEYNYQNSPPIKIYRKEANSGDWVLKQRVRLHHISSCSPELLEQLGDWNSFAVLSVIWSDDGKSLDMVLLIYGLVVSYNTRSRTVKELLRIEGFTGIHDFKWYWYFQFNETLSWLPPPV